MTIAWKPTASIENLRLRAQVVREIRDFFNDRGYLEVETPVMAKFGVTDVYLNNMTATFRDQSYQLQTSPEYHMKRLLAVGSGPIFQLFRAFRDDELGRWHNPEFTLLEWYKLDVDHFGLMDEMDEFLQTILSCGSMKRLSYQEAFIQATGLDPFAATINALKTLLKIKQLDGVLSESEEDKDVYLFLLMSHVVEPFFAKEQVPVAIYGFPPSQAALAKLTGNTAARFEVYYQGVELANGFYELTDPNLQKNRFDEDNIKRRQLGIPAKDPDSYFLAALNHGLPHCSGVALGIDRLIALKLNQPTISSVMAFSVDNA